MCAEQTFDIEANYKKSYPAIFSFFYLIEGIHQAIPTFLSIYLMFVFGEFNAFWVAFIGFVTVLPWSFKFLVGIVNDKWGSEKYGRRFPFIIIFGGIAGITWILMTFFLPLDKSIYIFLVYYLLINNIGVAVADTCVDGLILDVTPKTRLAKIQGYTWTMLMLGGAGGAAIALVLFWNNMVPLLFLITGITMIISCYLMIYITEPPLGKEPKIVKELKRIISEKNNYKVFAWTLVTAMAYPLIVGAFFYLMLVSAGMINFQEVIASLGESSSKDEYLWINIIISIFNGVGVVLGSLVVGRFADKTRKSALNFVYLIYIPFCFLSNLFIGMFFGLVAQVIFGFVYGSITIVGQTIRGDIAKKNFPEMKSTYYALLISFSNLGQAFGNLMLAFMIASVAPLLSDFYILFFIITLVSTALITMSYLIFRTINPEEYEFEGKITDVMPT